MAELRPLAELRSTNPDALAREQLALLQQMHRLAVASTAPVAPHLEIALHELIEPLTVALNSVPDAASYLEKLPLGEAFLAVMYAVGRKLRIPVRVRAGQADWARLASLIRPEHGQYTPRHAARVWSSLTMRGRAVRVRRYSATPKGSRKGRKYRWAWRCRADGTPFASSGKTYHRALIKSLAYASREALCDYDGVWILSQLADALPVPTSWRAARWARYRREPLLRYTNLSTQLLAADRHDLKDLVATLKRREKYDALARKRARRSREVISKNHRSAVKTRGPYGTPSGANARRRSSPSTRGGQPDARPQAPRRSSIGASAGSGATQRAAGDSPPPPQPPIAAGYQGEGSRRLAVLPTWTPPPRAPASLERPTTHDPTTTTPPQRPAALRDWVPAWELQ